MKKIKCPKCGEYLTFDASKYDDGQILVFDCPECHKRFKIRIGRDKLRDKEQIWELMWTLPSRPQTPAWTGVIATSMSAVTNQDG